jgi:hypothetical protein
MAGTGARYFFLFLIGLVMGAILSVMGLRAYQARQDPFPHALMHVQEWHLHQLKADFDANRCNATDTLPHLSALRMTADDIESAFPGLHDDPRFAKAAGQLRATLDAARANPPLNCPAVGKVVQDIGAACKACHQDFR